MYEVRCKVCRDRNWQTGGHGRSDFIGFVASTGEWFELGRTIDVGSPEWAERLQDRLNQAGITPDHPEFDDLRRALSHMYKGEYRSAMATTTGIVKVIKSLEEWPEWGSSGLRGKCRRGHRVNADHHAIAKGIAVAERVGRRVLFL